ncbi:hypothetical protein CKO27_13515 [Thiocystis violacea]|nr:hypothetical protein [Thiocystis violacea]
MDQTDWQRAAARLDDYLQAMGVKDPAEIASLCEQVRLTAEARACAMPLEDPVEAAIEEIGALLDRWLTQELGGDIDADTLCAARASVLGGSVPGWSARWAGFTEDSPGAAIRAARLVPVPERAPLVMEPNRIDLCCYRLRRRFAAVLDWLLGRSGGRTHPAGEHS